MTAGPTCVILAGGLGTRLRGVVGGLPKCLAPVGGRPFLALQLDALAAAGVGDMVLSLGHGAQQIIDAMQSEAPRRPLRWVVEPELLGTGGAIAHTLDSIGLSEAWVANGDTFLEGDLSALLPPLDTPRNERLRMGLVQVDDRGRFGGVRIGATGRVAGFLEKGQHGPGWINAGLYRLQRSALPAGRSAAYSLESDVLPGLVASGTVTACKLQARFTDIGVPDDYHRFCAEHGAAVRAETGAIGAG